VVGPAPIDEMDLSYLMALPQMIVSLNVVFTTSGQTFILDLPDNYSNCFFDNVRSLFEFHNTLKKYCLVINASNFHSITAVIWFNPSTDVGYTGWQNCYHKYVDIKGTTIVDFEIPYVEAAFSSGKGGPMTLYMTILTWAQPQSAFPIDVNIYKAGQGQVGCYMDCDWNNEDGPADFYAVQRVQMEFNPRAHFTKPFSKFHEGLSDYEHKALLWGEQVTSVRQLIHRSTPYYKCASSSDYYTWNRAKHSDGVGLVNQGLEMFGMMYVMWRGSITMKLLANQNNNDLTRTMCIRDLAGNALAGFHTTSNNNPVLEITVPYMYVDAYQWTACNATGTPLANDSWVLANSAAFNTEFLFKEAGDDFSFAFAIPLPNGSRFSKINLSATLGYSGYTSFVATQTVSELFDINNNRLPRVHGSSEDEAWSDTETYSGRETKETRVLSKFSDARSRADKGKARKA